MGFFLYQFQLVPVFGLHLGHPSGLPTYSAATEAPPQWSGYRAFLGPEGR
jgi:hypothetical protein